MASLVSLGIPGAHVVGTVGTELVKVVELSPDGRTARVVSGISVILYGPVRRSYGVLGAHSARPRSSFTLPLRRAITPRGEPTDRRTDQERRVEEERRMAARRDGDRPAPRHSVAAATELAMSIRSEGGWRGAPGRRASSASSGEGRGAPQSCHGFRLARPGAGRRRGRAVPFLSAACRRPARTC
jgi:hypothetical protein